MASILSNLTHIHVYSYAWYGGTGNFWLEVHDSADRLLHDRYEIESFRYSYNTETGKFEDVASFEDKTKACSGYISTSDSGSGQTITLTIDSVTKDYNVPLYTEGNKEIGDLSAQGTVYVDDEFICEQATHGGLSILPESTIITSLDADYDSQFIETEEVEDKSHNTITVYKCKLVLKLSGVVLYDDCDYCSKVNSVFPILSVTNASKTANGEFGELVLDGSSDFTFLKAKLLSSDPVYNFNDLDSVSDDNAVTDLYWSTEFYVPYTESADTGYVEPIKCSVHIGFLNNVSASSGDPLYLVPFPTTALTSTSGTAIISDSSALSCYVPAFENTATFSDCHWFLNTGDGYEHITLANGFDDDDADSYKISVSVSTSYKVMIYGTLKEDTDTNPQIVNAIGFGQGYITKPTPIPYSFTITVSSFLQYTPPISSTLSEKANTVLATKGYADDILPKTGYVTIEYNNGWTLTSNNNNNYSLSRLGYFISVYHPFNQYVDVQIIDITNTTTGTLCTLPIMYEYDEDEESWYIKFNSYSLFSAGNAKLRINFFNG